MLDDALAKFRAALHEQLQHPEEGSAACTSAVTALAAAAHVAGIRVEQLIILIKEEWDRAVQKNAGGDPFEHQHLRRVLVTSAIKAYYLQ